jgi:hypothetical protein
VKLLDLLNEAGIKNLNVDFIGQYATKIDTATPAPEKYVDVQKLIDEVNKDNAETETLVTPVLEAKTQLALLNALEANYERVNKDWIMAYVSDGTAVGIQFTAADTDNKVYNDTTGTAVTSVDAEVIQDVIDAVNLAQITAADTAATTLEDQAKVTALIQNWMKADNPETPKVTPKADAIKASQVKEAVLRVKEATTQNSVYNALVNLANLDNDTLKPSDLNANLASFYFAEQQDTTKNAALDKDDVSTVVSNIVTDTTTDAADQKALKAAMEDIVTKFGALNSDDTNATKKAEFKASLQKLADYTSHLTGTAKFDMKIVKDENLVKYAAEFAAATAIDATSTVADVVTKINDVNDAQGLDAALATINDTKSTATEVRDALLEIAVALSEDAVAGTNAKAFINLVPQARLEVAEFVKEARVDAGADFADLDAILSTTDGNGALKTAYDKQQGEIAKFNAIGDLASVDVTDIKDALDTYAYDEYKALTTAEKIAVAEEISKLVHVDKDGVETPYDFTTGTGADAVETLAEANAIIDAAIAAIK